ncbi:oxidoreductase, molybdopterin-binding subunit [Streptomyces griseoflavus Tu4000]|uniref:Oxidoreductase, molybdopterin-binding subunit n=1 Tax=Streptomyces griseoflavus Tu4000 TaxID=467200 RepID=D9Y0T4_9ACTN|nr:oxidoreductase, molybdopterin-binding subunit [Streptomyces griseoflavus Tu4000]
MPLQRLCTDRRGGLPRRRGEPHRDRGGRGMREFDYRRADDVSGAVALLGDDPDARYLGGGTNLVDLMKNGVERPARLVDVRGLPLDRIEPAGDGGLRIGATVTNSDLAAHPGVRRNYPALTQAVLAGASGQLRNMATVGGNLLQRTRCGYFTDVTKPCNKRRPGSGCPAVEGEHHNHAILGASGHCVAVHPSDMGVALTAFDAVVTYRIADGEWELPLADFFSAGGGHPAPGDRPAARRARHRRHPAARAVSSPAPATARSANAPRTPSRSARSPPRSTSAAESCARPGSPSGRSPPGPGGPAPPKPCSTEHLPPRSPSRRRRTPNSRPPGRCPTTDTR